MSGNNWGGKRPNQTGRPAVADKRVIRGVAFNSAEWGAITDAAKRRGLSVRAYILSLVEKDAAATIH